MTENDGDEFVTFGSEIAMQLVPTIGQFNVGYVKDPQNPNKQIAPMCRVLQVDCAHLVCLFRSAPPPPAATPAG